MDSAIQRAGVGCKPVGECRRTRLGVMMPQIIIVLPALRVQRELGQSMSDAN